jgi:hypothetical protein
MFVTQDWMAGQPKPIVQVQGILRSGNPSEASIKGQIKIFDADSEESEEDEEEE